MANWSTSINLSVDVEFQINKSEFDVVVDDYLEAEDDSERDAILRDFAENVVTDIFAGPSNTSLKLIDGQSWGAEEELRRYIEQRVLEREEK